MLDDPIVAWRRIPHIAVCGLADPLTPDGRTASARPRSFLIVSNHRQISRRVTPTSLAFKSSFTLHRNETSMSSLCLTLKKGKGEEKKKRRKDEEKERSNLYTSHVLLSTGSNGAIGRMEGVGGKDSGKERAADGAQSEGECISDVWEHIPSEKTSHNSH